MKVFLLIVGIVCIVACALALLYSAFNHYAHRHVLDGSAELYQRLQRRARIFFISGIVLALLGAACLIIRGRI
jgi:hypothetical protein